MPEGHPQAGLTGRSERRDTITRARAHSTRKGPAFRMEEGGGHAPVWVSDRQGAIPRHNDVTETDVTEPTAPTVHKQLGRNNDRICRPGRPPRGLVGCHRARDATTVPLEPHPRRSRRDGTRRSDHVPRRGGEPGLGYRRLFLPGMTTFFCALPRGGNVTASSQPRSYVWPVPGP